MIPPSETAFCVNFFHGRGPCKGDKMVYVATNFDLPWDGGVCMRHLSATDVNAKCDTNAGEIH